VLTAVEVEGFKRFHSVRLALAPLTVLTGLNGSGKSSLVQAILLAQEAATRRGDTLRLNGPFGLELGTAEDVLNWESRAPIRLRFEGTGHQVSEWGLTVPSEDAMYLHVDGAPGSGLMAFGGAARAFTYLSAERLGPRGVAATSPLAEGELEVGVHGEFCAHVLDVLGGKLMEHTGRSHPSQDQATSRLLKYEVERWLGEVARPVEINGERVAGSTVAELRYRTGGGEWVRATNMGFGVTYALPIILAGLIAVPDGILLVENPEAHLHPAGQSRMGTFLAWLAGRGVQAVIETHSDHVLNGIRRAVAEFAYLGAADACIHWFGGLDADGEAGIETLAMGEAGSLSDWPRGFFDQYQTDVAALGRLRRARTHR
jgi:predicted ATPase